MLPALTRRLARVVALTARWALPCWLLSACADGSAGAGADEPEPDPVSFAADVHPILLQKCAGSSCHSVSMGPFRPGHAAADVNEAYAATQQTGLMQQPVYRRMLARASSADPTLVMPPSWATPPCDGAVGTPGCLSEDELALIDAWVAQGAPP
ncbi:MAG TPA: hypothetical protein VNN80_25705 [Polyangiaceae bacterium]|nr:hypothetical protein [Polyangiaceae bacterium]